MNQEDSLSRSHHLKLEVYRSLKEENNLEARDTMSLDAIFVAGTVAWLLRPHNLSLPSSCILLVGYVLLLLLWYGLAWRTHKRIHKRIDIMLCIEKHVGFCAYRAMEDHIQKEFCLLKYPNYRLLILVVILVVIAVEVGAHLLKC